MAVAPIIARITPIADQRPHRIEILAFEGAQILDITGPAQVFATANELCRDPAHPLYEIVVVASGPQVATSSGIIVATVPTFSCNDGLGTLIVSGGYGVGTASKDGALLDWVRRRSAIAERTASVCSGAFLLAEAGLLDGRRAVTHWGRCAEFRRTYPAVRLDPEPIFIRDGSIWTSAGVTAGIDLALAMVEADHGHRLALSVARQLVVFLKRPGGQGQFSATLALQSEDGSFATLHGWIAEHLDRKLSLPELAEEAGMSLRTFSRRYRTAMGCTPAVAVERIRIESARRHLENGATVSRTAQQCGFGSTETMRRAFLRALDVSPNSYRDRFRNDFRAASE